jgi:hypothetical protein
MKPKILLIASLVGLCFAFNAMAGTLPANITLSLNSVSGGETYNGWNAGEMVVQIIDDPVTPVQYTGTYNGFCVDPASASYSFQDYVLLAMPPTADYQQSAYILFTYGTAFGNPSGNEFEAQVAIWQIMFLNMPSLAPGPSADLVSAMKAAAQAAVTGGWSAADHGIVLAHSPRNSQATVGALEVDYQDFIVGVPDGGLTVMLLGLGVGGLALFSRKFRQ